MKHLSTGWIIAIVLCSIATGSCKKSEPAPVINVPSTTFSATVDGKSFYAEDIAVTITGNKLTMQGTRDPGSSKAATITLTTDRFVGLSSYEIDSLTTARYTDVSGNYVADSGNINVITNNEVHLAGTFHFRTSGATKEVTNGRFDVYK